MNYNNHAHNDNVVQLQAIKSSVFYAVTQVANTAVLQQIGGRLPQSLPESPIPLQQFGAPPSPISSSMRTTGMSAGSPGSPGGSAECFLGQPNEAAHPRSTSQLLACQNIIITNARQCCCLFPDDVQTTSSLQDPSCPLVGGCLNSYSLAPPRRRADSPDPRVLSHACPGSCPASTSCSTQYSSACHVHPAVQPAVPLCPLVASPPLQQQAPQQQQHWYRQPIVHDMPTQGLAVQQQQCIQGAHPSELADVRSLVHQLIHDQQSFAGATASKVSSLIERLSVVEQQLPSASSATKPGTAARLWSTARQSESTSAVHPVSRDMPATASDAGHAVGTAVARVAEAWAAGVVGAASISDGLNKQDVVAAIEGLAADSVQVNARLTMVEQSVQQQQSHLDQCCEDQARLSGKLQQVRWLLCRIIHQLSACELGVTSCTCCVMSCWERVLQPVCISTFLVCMLPHLQASLDMQDFAKQLEDLAQVQGTHDGVVAVPDVLPEPIQQQVLQQLLNSQQLQHLLNVQVEQAVQARMGEAIRIAVQNMLTSGARQDAVLGPGSFGGCCSCCRCCAPLQLVTGLYTTKITSAAR